MGRRLQDRSATASIPNHVPVLVWNSFEGEVAVRAGDFAVRRDLVVKIGLVIGVGVKILNVFVGFVQ